MDWKTLFFAADGRIGRQEFWIGFIVLFAVNWVLAMVPVIGWLASLALIWCSICLFAKRLHDMGKSAWLQLIPVIASAAGLVVAMVTGGAALLAAALSGDSTDPTASPALLASLGIAAGALGLSGLVGLIFLMWAGVSAGDAETNRFGPPPGKPAPAAA